jgi:hypothetical protein
LILSSVFTSTTEYTREYTKEVAYPTASAFEVKESMEDKIIRVAGGRKEIETKLYNIVEGESSFNAEAIGDMDVICNFGPNKGKPVRARGIVQITECSHPEITDEQAFDPDWALTWAVGVIEKGDEWKEWTVCNCFSYAQVLTDYKLPKMMEILPNSNYPRVGGLVILRYKNDKHIGVVDEVIKEGVWIREANFKPCLTSRRLIEWDDLALKGFRDSPEL